MTVTLVHLTIFSSWTNMNILSTLIELNLENIRTTSETHTVQRLHKLQLQMKLNQHSFNIN